MARYLCDITDGKPRYCLDEDGGADPMLYTLDNQWAGYISSDGASVLSREGRQLFSISENYFYGAGGVVLYSADDEEPETSESERLEELHEWLRRASDMRGFLFRICETIGIKPIVFTDSQIEIILSSTSMLNVFDHVSYFSHVVERLRDQAQIDDEAVQRASEQAQQEFQQQQS
jgi:hypothetical protein